MDLALFYQWFDFSFDVLKRLAFVVGACVCINVFLLHHANKARGDMSSTKNVLELPVVSSLPPSFSLCQMLHHFHGHSVPPHKLSKNSSSMKCYRFICILHCDIFIRYKSCHGKLKLDQYLHVVTCH